MLLKNYEKKLEINNLLDRKGFVKIIIVGGKALFLTWKGDLDYDEELDQMEEDDIFFNQYHYGNVLKLYNPYYIN